MNKFIVFLLALLPAIAFGQQKEITTDSSWIVNRNGVFYQVKYQVFNTGEETTNIIPIGDTTTTVNRFRENIKSAATTFASDAQIVSGYRLQITELIRFGRTLPALLGKSPLDSLRNDQKNLLDAGWSVNGTGLRFRVTGAGAFQWKADTTTQWRAAAFVGSVIRLNSFNGYTTDFFRNAKNRWTTISQQYTIRQPADVAARLDSADLPEEQAAEPTAPTTELLPGGIVRVGEKEFKYNTKTKQWVQR